MWVKKWKVAPLALERDTGEIKYINVCARGCNERSDLGVGDGQGVHPDTPATPLVFDRVVEQDSEDGVDHLCDFLLLCGARVDEAQREHPLLPHGALQQAPTTTTGSIAQSESHRRNAVHLVKQPDSYLRFSRLLLNSLIMSDRKTLRTSMVSGEG